MRLMATLSMKTGWKAWMMSRTRSNHGMRIARSMTKMKTAYDE
jgi:hypothetical protein